MRAASLFLSTMDDLRDRVSAPRGDGYEILRSSGLLRQLLMDGQPLVHIVNRAVRMPLRFEIGRGDLDADLGVGVPSPVVRWLNPYPFDLPSRTTDLGGFLKYSVIEAHGQRGTVGDVIRVCAHVLGGVHFGDAKTAAERALEELNGSLEVNGIGMLIENLLGIGRVTLTGLQPLYDEALRRR